MRSKSSKHKKPLDCVLSPRYCKTHWVFVSIPSLSALVNVESVLNRMETINDDGVTIPNMLIIDQLHNPQPLSDEFTPTITNATQSYTDHLNVIEDVNTIDESTDLSSFESDIVLWYVYPTTSQWMFGENVNKPNEHFHDIETGGLPATSTWLSKKQTLARTHLPRNQEKISARF